jgi:uncharacterized protein with ParB-like and HNH nuclease domain
MTTTTSSREIDGKGRTVRELLTGRKYSIDYYQREYKWQKKQVKELLEDLAAKFLERLIPLSQVNQNLGLAGQIRNGAEFEFFGRS